MIKYTVTVIKKGYGRFSGSDYSVSSLTFTDERKARDHYAEMLVRYPNCNVEFLKSEK